MYLVDTNIFLEVLLARSRKEECKKLLSQLRDGKKTGLVTDFTVHSIIVTMDNLNKLTELRIFLSSLIAYKGLHVHHTSITDEVKATETATKNKLDMDDAIQYTTALALNAEAIISFDKHFNNLKIPRKEPRQIS
jgi:predicted nucleic acid-binding protein